jgi:hypothetical protein
LEFPIPLFVIKISKHLDNPPVLSDLYPASKEHCPRILNVEGTELVRV